MFSRDFFDIWLVILIQYEYLNLANVSEKWNITYFNSLIY